MKTTSKRGGKRKGAGRPPAGTVELKARVQPATKAAIQRRAKAQGLTPGQLLDLGEW